MTFLFLVMQTIDRKSHWEKVYDTKQLCEVSWYQARPDISLGFLEQFNLPKNAKIIDVGGGDSLLVDYLLERNYTDITVLDISEKALNRAKLRLGKRGEKIKWIVADAGEFIPKEKYDCWHDRAAFHFLTDEKSINHYVKNVEKNINPNGYLILGTFSENGPEKCSGLEIKQYSEKSMTDRLLNFFEKIKCLTVEHLTPTNKIQEFIFCSFQKIRTA
jgi:2-polyprenyl-3-methyl-5-hydroxy-6-metoxy-1,4-benzoquinol methylase